jgi:hypothetical protein
MHVGGSPTADTHGIGTADTHMSLVAAHAHRILFVLEIGIKSFSR